MENKNIYTALLEAQKQIETIKKDATAGKGTFSYNYATLGQVMEMIKQPLNNNGIIVTQPIMGDRVITSLMYTDGTKIEDSGTVIVCARPNDPQAQGSAITYARRYGLMSLLCLSAEDDDGAKAMPHASLTAPQQTKPLQPSNIGSCPKCSSPLVLVNSEKVYAKCSTSKWDPATKTASGCNYVKWQSNKKSADHMEEIVNEVPDITVEEVEEAMPF